MANEKDTVVERKEESVKVETSEEDKVSEKVSVVSFGKKRRGAAKRLRSREVTKEAGENGGDLQKEGEDEKGDEQTRIRKEVDLLREVQRLREQQRRRDMLHVQKPRQVEKRADEDDEALIAGLRTNFAVERENEDLELQCEKFIAERMKSRGFDNGLEEDGKEQKNPEDELYDVPENLRVQERPAYDPGEGLPAAGLEEVELDDQVKKKNQTDTMNAVRMMRKGRARATDHLVAERFKKRFKR